MPYDLKRFVLVQVPLPVDSQLVAHLKAEATRYSGHPHLGPHIAALLTDRDAHIYGTAEGAGKGIWFPPAYGVHVPASKRDEPATLSEEVSENTIESIADQARAMASFGGEDEWDE